MKKLFKILIWIILITGVASLAEFFFLPARNASRSEADGKKIKMPAPQPQSSLSEPRQSEAATTANTTIPETQPAADPEPSPAQDSIVTSNPLPTKHLLDIPFYPQAPLGKWDTTHENACEEASILNGGLFLLGKKLTPDEFDKEMMRMIDIEKKLSINFSDSTIAETKQFSDQYFGGKINSKIIDSPSIENIDTEVTAGHPVIVPLSGRDIGNPNFTPPGPVYHMLTIKGFDSQDFITNDVGTRKGDSYTYKKDVIMKNMHDWNAKDIHLGAKRVLVLYK